LVETSDEITYFKKGFCKKFLKNGKNDNHDMANYIGKGTENGKDNDNSGTNNKIVIPVEGSQNPNKGANGIMDKEKIKNIKKKKYIYIYIL